MKDIIYIVHSHPLGCHYNSILPQWVNIILNQAKISNPGANIHLISDVKLNIENVNNHLVKDYTHGLYQDFTSNFTNLSSNYEIFELPAFQRWFILYNFLEKHKIDSCIHLDSDVMIFCDLEHESQNYKNYWFTLCKNQSGHTNFIRHISKTKDFIEFLTNIYTNKSGSIFTNLKNTYLEMQKKKLNGGICDMTLWKIFSHQHKDY
ncbi:MAG: hypothetical protein EBY39_05525, partial [Flavobacteriia bacterium]|nr:hypothetical protein [Flavobacteriia bacterium]